MQRYEFTACAVLAATLLSAPSTAQAVFLPIPNASGVPIPGPFQAGHLSGFVPAPGALFGTDRSSVRVSADGSTVVLRVAKSTPSGLAADIAIWTENGGVEVLAPDDGIFGWGVSGISSDGAVVHGPNWVWTRTGGCQSLAAPLQALGNAAIFGCICGNCATFRTDRSCTTGNRDLLSIEDQSRTWGPYFISPIVRSNLNRDFGVNFNDCPSQAFSPDFQ